jgi:hypothetical protein
MKILMLLLICACIPKKQTETEAQKRFHDVDFEDIDDFNDLPEKDTGAEEEE